MHSKESRKAEIVSLARGLNILQSFQSKDAPMGNKEISERTNLSKATVARLSHTLVKMGYLRQINPHGKYHLDDNVTVLGHAFLQTLNLRQAAEPMMQEFAERNDMSVALGVGNGVNMIYLCYCAGTQTATMRLSVGTLVPMYLSAMGYAYLSALPLEQREIHLCAIRDKLGDKAEDREIVLKESIKKAELRGFSVSFGAWRREIFAVGAPVWLDHGETVAALNCGARQRNQSRDYYYECLGPELMVLSSDISRRLDHIGAPFWNE